MGAMQNKKGFLTFNGANRIMVYILVLLIILNSKSVYFGILHASASKMVLLMVSMIFFVVHAKKWNLKRLGGVTLDIFLLFFFLFLAGLWNGCIIDNIRPFFLVFVISFLVVNCVSVNEFARAYIDIMSIIAAVSLVCFLMSCLLPQIPLILGKRILVNGSYYIVSPYYTWGWYYVMHRNSGIFWEPGAFQGFLNIALLFATRKNRAHASKWQFIILVLAVFTTMSTTGYMVLGCILLLRHKVILKTVLSKIKKEELKWMLLVAGSAIIIVVFSSGTIWNKFQNTNSSFAIRNNDTVQGVELFLEKPVFGWGITEELNEEMVTRQLEVNSNGLLAVLFSFGGMFGMTYFGLMSRGLDTVFEIQNMKERMAVYVIFVALFATEAIYWFPVYCIFVLGRNMRKE